MRKHDYLFSGADMEGPRVWLRTILLPTLVDPVHLERQGFNPVFIQRFNKKHDHVLRLDGVVVRGVRGVNELELLRGIAEALGVRSFKDRWDSRDTVTTTKVARQCLDALAAMEKGQGSDDATVQS